MANCTHGNSMPDDIVAGLHPSQGGTGRHRCAICAFAMGVNHALGQGPTETCQEGSIAPTVVLSNLPDSQAGPGRHKCTNCAFVEGLALSAVDLEGEAILEDSPDEQDFSGAVEGIAVYRRHKVLERSGRNRALAILHHGNRCFGCGFFFDDVYTPEHARGFIEVHHVRPLSTGIQFVDPLQDLVPLCANCHRMVHRRADNWLTVQQLQALMAQASGSPSL